MLNSIGIPMAGLAPPPGGGAGIEQPTGAGGFAALLAAASQPQTPATQAGVLPGIDAASLLDVAAVIDGAPVVAEVPLTLEQVLTSPLVLDRPDRSSEVGNPEGSKPEVEPASPQLDGSSLAAILLQLAPPPIPVPVPTPAPTAVVAPVAIDGESTVTQAVEPSDAGTPATPEAARGQAPGASAETVPVVPVTTPPERPETSRASEERFSDLVRATEPQDRGTIAASLSREGGRFDGDQPSRPEQAAVPATPAQPKDDAPAVPSTGNAPIDAVDGAGDGTAEHPSERDLRESQAGPDQPVDATARADSNAAQAASGAASQRPTEVSTFRTEQSVPPIEARDAAALNRGLVDSVHAAVRNGDDSIRLVLNPPDLGHLDIRVTSGTDGVRVAVTAATSEAADLIRQHLPGLVSGLEARDLRVDRAEVRQTASAELGTDLGSSQSRTDSRQPGDRGDDGQPQWAPPDWSGVAALERAAARTTTRSSEQASTRLLDLVA